MKILRNDPALKERRRILRKTQTDAEGRFWAQVRNKQIRGLKFFRQYSVGPYILDFYCPERKLAVELDGGQHNEFENREYDGMRTEFLKSHGINVLRFWNNEVLQNMEGVLSRVEENITPPVLPLA